MSNYPDVDEFNEDFDDPYDYDDSIDFDSAMTSAGFGTDEDYNHWTEEF